MELYQEGILDGIGTPGGVFVFVLGEIDVEISAEKTQTFNSVI